MSAQPRQLPPAHSMTALQILDACDALGLDYHGVSNVCIDVELMRVTVTRHIQRPHDEQHWPMSLDQVEVYPIVEAAPR